MLIVEEVKSSLESTDVWWSDDAHLQQIEDSSLVLGLVSPAPPGLVTSMLSQCFGIVPFVMWFTVFTDHSV